MQLVYLRFNPGSQLFVLCFQQQQPLNNLLDELDKRLNVLYLVKAAGSQHASLSDNLGELVLLGQLLNVVRLRGDCL